MCPALPPFKPTVSRHPDELWRILTNSWSCSGRSGWPLEPTRAHLLGRRQRLLFEVPGRLPEKTGTQQTSGKELKNQSCRRFFQLREYVKQHWNSVEGTWTSTSWSNGMDPLGYSSMTHRPTPTSGKLGDRQHAYALVANVLSTRLRFNGNT